MYEFRAVALSDVWNVSSIKCGSRTNNICIIRKNIYNYGPNSRSNANFSFQFIANYVWWSMEYLAGDPMLGLKFV